MDGMTLTIPFVRSSDTSKAAAEAKRATVASDLERVYAFIESRGSFGATDDEMEAALDMRHASSRRNGLARAGRVMDSGERRRTRSNRKAAVWVVGKGEAPDGSGNDRVSRPNPEALRAAATSLERAHPALADVARWLRHIAR